ncbi:GtrA domain-containing protein [Streptomyces geranii]|uniref:GtrA family protein n=1 Tax=Streptomyces geranii TaxID=2058923 RepID=UPI001E395900|nr:GtrA family protein [Streptomyces geranii]
MKSQLSSKPSTTGAAAAPGPFASFARFVLCGGGVGLLSSGAVALLAAAMPWALANALITVASTILCTELHARFTFGAGKRAGWRQHWQSAGSATAAYVVTCVAMFVLHLVQSSPGMLTEQIVYLSASGLAGIGRFLVLRVFVFAVGRNKSTASAPAPAQAPVLVPVEIPVPVTAPVPAAAPVAVAAPALRRVLRAPAMTGLGSLGARTRLAVS